MITGEYTISAASMTSRSISWRSSTAIVHPEHPASSSIAIFMTPPHFRINFFRQAFGPVWTISSRAFRPVISSIAPTT